MRVIISALIFVLLLSFCIKAQESLLTILDHKISVFTNTNCHITRTCSLKTVEYIVENYKINISEGDNYGTRFFARYTTNSTTELEKYVFVQFIKGCDFSSQLVDGDVRFYYDVVYPRTYDNVPFNFPEWTLDSYDPDPVYSTVPGRSRFYGYRWNKVRGSFATDTELLYGQKKPKYPQLYIVDHPGSAFYEQGIGHNISLQFRTCIYRTKDVPKSVSYEKTDFARPLHCFEWNSSFVFNHFTGEFESFPEISQTCK